MTDRPILVQEVFDEWDDQINENEDVITVPMMDKITESHAISVLNYIEDLEYQVKTAINMYNNLCAFRGQVFAQLNAQQDNNFRDILQEFKDEIE